MSEDTNHQDPIGMWQRSIEQGMEAWKAAVPQTIAALQMWGQAASHGMETWSHIAQQDTSTPEALAQWKKLMDESVETWSKSLAETMATEGFAALMGQSLEQYLNAVGPARKNLQTGSEEVLRTLNMPSRKQVTRLAASVVAVDERVETVEERLEAMNERLKAMQDQLARLLDRLSAETATEKADRPAGPRAAKRRPQKEVAR
jgi:hypothetical protein